jgi:hypothetical protein
MKRATAALLPVANLLFFWPVLFHGRVFSSHDVVLSEYPWKARSEIAAPRNRLLSDPATSSETQLRHFRRFPEGFFWNRGAAGGIPGPINIVQGDLSPFFWLPALALPESAIETGILFLKFNASFFFAWLLFRRLGFSQNAAAVASAGWAWSTGQSVWWLWMQTSVSLFFPLLLLCAEESLVSRTTRRSVALGGIIFLGFLSAGYPFWIVYGVFAAGLYVLFRIPEAGARAAWTAAVRLAASFVLALAILFPAYRLSWRFLRETGHVESRRGVGAQFAMPLRQLRLYLAPDFAGDPSRDDYRGVGAGPFDNYFETACGVGPIVLGLAALSLANRKRRALAAYAAALALFVGIPLYGGGTALKLVGSLPGFSEGVFLRARILIVFAISIACAVGAESLEDALGSSTPARRLLPLLPYLAAVPLLFEAAKSYPAVERRDALFSPTPGITRLEELARAAPSRYLATGGTLMPNVGETFGLEDVRGHLMHEKSYREILRSADPSIDSGHGTFLLASAQTLDPLSPALDLLNVTAIAAAPGSKMPLETLYDGPDLVVFSRPTAFPRFFAVSRVEPGGAAETAAATRDALAGGVFLSTSDTIRLAPKLIGSDPTQARISIARYRAESFSVDVTTRDPVILASSQKIFEPYWRGFLDGRPAPAVRCDGLFFGVLVPAGSHRIEGRFEIPRPEIAVSLAGLGVLLGLLVLEFARP